jgi:hypothetical protein
MDEGANRKSGRGNGKENGSKIKRISQGTNPSWRRR